ncbi:hypothetical protein MFLAVUS_002519 [Mucor flavus]|uniref:Uncharacterized protein n=1 Tax=Mucor flavus TaxID=439312 RepID=A0ABP9YQI3_9FUNG
MSQVSFLFYSDPDAGTAYELWLESRLEIKPKFEDKVEKLPKVVNLYWSMKCILEEAVRNVFALNAKHNEMIKKFRFSTFSTYNLASVINPSIMKLTEEEDKTEIDHIDDLDWIRQMDVPLEIKNYAMQLKEAVPEKASVKVKNAKRISKSPINNCGIIIYDSNITDDVHLGDKTGSSSTSNYDNNNNNKRQPDSQNDDTSSRPKKKENPNEKTSSIWKDWLANSLEYHKVVRVGRGVSPKPNLDKELYNRHLDIHKSELYSFSNNTIEYMNTNLKEFKKMAQRTLDADDEEETVFITPITLQAKSGRWRGYFQRFTLPLLEVSPEFRCRI